MQLDDAQLATVCGGESFSDVFRAIRALPNVSPDQTYGQTLDFIKDHPFFHRGVMDAPIGGGKHFRNVPFVGPTRFVGGAVVGDATEMARGAAITRATWDAP